MMQYLNVNEMAILIAAVSFFVSLQFLERAGIKPSIKGGAITIFIGALVLRAASDWFLAMAILMVLLCVIEIKTAKDKVFCRAFLPLNVSIWCFAALGWITGAFPFGIEPAAVNVMALTLIMVIFQIIALVRYKRSGMASPREESNASPTSEEGDTVEGSQTPARSEARTVGGEATVAGPPLGTEPRSDTAGVSSNGEATVAGSSLGSHSNQSNGAVPPEHTEKEDKVKPVVWLLLVGAGSAIALIGYWIVYTALPYIPQP